MQNWQQIWVLVKVKCRQSFTSIKIAPMVFMPILMAITMNLVLPTDVEPQERQSMILIMSIAFFGCISPMSVAMYHLTEDKENRTLRLVLDSGVSPQNYLLSVLLATNLLMWGIVLLLFPFIGFPLDLVGWVLILHYLILILISGMLGLMFGLFSDQTASASALSMVPMLALSLIPLYSSFNQTLTPIMNILYTGRPISLIFKRDLNGWGMDIAIHASWLVLSTLLLLFLYRRRPIQLVD